MSGLVAATHADELGWHVSETGLSAPIQPAAGALEGTMAEFVTLEQLAGKSLTTDEIACELSRYSLDAVLIAIAGVLHGLFRHPEGMKVAERDLVDLLPPPLQQRFRALPVSSPATDRVITSPQAMLNLAKIALTRHEPADGQLVSMPFAAILVLGVAMASHLERDMLEVEAYWDQPADLFVYMFANHNLYSNEDDAAQIARARSLEHLRHEIDPERSRLYDEVFRSVTSASPKAARLIASSFWVGSQSGPILSAEYGSNAVVSAEERTAAIATVATDPATLKSLIEAEHKRLGAKAGELKGWAFNSFRQYPVVRLSDGRYLIIHPGFLVDHMFDFDYDRSVVWSFPEDEDRSRFRTFRGSAHERLVGMSVDAIFPSSPLLSKRVWTDEELKALWNGRHCDFLIDGGSAILLIEVVSHPLNEKAVAGVSLQAVDDEIQTMVISKARQLDESVKALLAHEENMLGAVSVASERAIVPLVVATSGFPWNLMSSRVVWRQLEAGGLLQQNRVKPLMVLDLKGVEAMESLAEEGNGVADMILRGIDAGHAGIGFEHLVIRQGASLRRPRRLDAWWPDEFRDMAEGFGFDPNDLYRPPEWG